MSTKRTINGTKFNIPQIVDEAIAAAENATLNLERTREMLRLMGYRDLNDEFVHRYAHEKAILDYLARRTGANFGGQIGKIDFSSRETAIQGVDAYLNRRIAGQHARWAAEHPKHR